MLHVFMASPRRTLPRTAAGRPVFMIPVLGSTSVVGATEFKDQRMDVCSAADFSYDSRHGELVGWLHSFLRATPPEHCRHQVKAP